MSHQQQQEEERTTTVASDYSKMKITSDSMNFVNLNTINSNANHTTTTTTTTMKMNIDNNSTFMGASNESQIKSPVSNNVTSSVDGKGKRKLSALSAGPVLSTAGDNTTTTITHMYAGAAGDSSNNINNNVSIRIDTNPRSTISRLSETPLRSSSYTDPSPKNAKRKLLPKQLPLNAIGVNDTNTTTATTTDNDNDIENDKNHNDNTNNTNNNNGALQLPLNYQQQMFSQYQPVFDQSPAQQNSKINFSPRKTNSNTMNTTDYNNNTSILMGATGAGDAVMNTNNNTTSFSSGRFDSSLGLLTKRFLSVIETLATPNHGLFDLSKAAELLQVQKRRIYDITNVLEGIGLIEKKGKNFIQWKRLVGDDKFENLDKVKGDLRMLQAKVEKNAHAEHALDDHIDRMRQYLEILSNDPVNQKHLYVTQGDLLSLKRQNADSSSVDRAGASSSSSIGTMIAVRAPQGTTLEVPDPSPTSPSRLFPNTPQPKFQNRNHYQIILKSRSGSIDVFLVNETDVSKKEIVNKDKDESKLDVPTSEQHDQSSVDDSILRLAPPETEPDYLFLHVPTNASLNMDCAQEAVFGQDSSMGIADLFSDKSPIQDGSSLWFGDDVLPA